MAKLRLLLSSSFFSKESDRNSLYGPRIMNSITISIEFFRPNTSEMQSFQPSFLFIPIQQKKNRILLSTLNARPMTCLNTWFHAFRFLRIFQRIKKRLFLYLLLFRSFKYVILWIKKVSSSQVKNLYACCLSLICGKRYKDFKNLIRKLQYFYLD